MQRTFNNGIGMVVIVPEASVQDVMDRLGAMNVNANLIGEIQSRDENEAQTEWI